MNSASGMFSTPFVPIYVQPQPRTMFPVLHPLQIAVLQQQQRHSMFLAQLAALSPPPTSKIPETSPKTNFHSVLDLATSSNKENEENCAMTPMEKTNSTMRPSRKRAASSDSDSPSSVTQCPLCDKTFTRHWLLQGHLRTHTGEKPFKCSTCQKGFADKSNLRAHQQTHTGVKPFACPRCGKSFALKSYLSKHSDSSCNRNVASATQNPHHHLLHSPFRF